MGVCIDPHANHGLSTARVMNSYFTLRLRLSGDPYIAIILIAPETDRVAFIFRIETLVTSAIFFTFHCFTSILPVATKYIRLWVILVYKARGCLYTPIYRPLHVYRKKLSTHHTHIQPHAPPVWGVWLCMSMGCAHTWAVHMDRALYGGIYTSPCLIY